MREHRRLAQKPSAFAQWLAANFPLYELPRKEIDYSGLQRLEAKYGDDPRYWQLLLQIQAIEGMLLGRESQSNSDSLLDRNDYYLRITDGVYNSGSFYLVPWLSARVEQEGLFSELLETAISSDPENAFFYYCKADWLQSYGELEAALEQTRLGNAAARNYLPLPFIPSGLLKYGDRFQSKESKQAAVMLNSVAVYNYIKIREKYVEQCMALAMGFPLETADEYIVRARRMGQQENVRLVEQNAAAMMAGVLFDYVPSECISLTAEQENELRVILDAMESVTTEADGILNQGKLGAPIYSWTGTTGWQTPTTNLDQASWDANLRTWPIVEKNRKLFDILDPPPFAIWARGELVGIDVSEADKGSGSTQDTPSD